MSSIQSGDFRSKWKPPPFLKVSAVTNVSRPCGVFATAWVRGRGGAALGASTQPPPDRALGRQQTLKN